MVGKGRVKRERTSENKKNSNAKVFIITHVMLLLKLSDTHNFFNCKVISELFKLSSSI